MTIVLVILAVLILLAVLFLISHVSKLSKTHRELMGSYYNAVIDSMLNLQKNITTQVETITTVIGSQQEEVVKLINKVEESNDCNKRVIYDLKHTITTIDNRLTAPIDKINDTHNRIKTLGKGATSSDELRDVVAKVVTEIARNAVSDTVNKLTKKPKTTKKVDNEDGVKVKA